MSTKVEKFAWILKNVVKDDEKERTESKNFNIRLGKKNSTKWTLKLVLNKEGNNTLELFLIKKKVNSDNFLVNFNVKINNEEFHWEKKAENIELGLWGWPCIMKIDDLFDDTKGCVDSSKRLKISFEVKLTEIDLNLSELSSSSASQSYSCETCSHYFENKAYSDFTLLCSDNVSIPVHRVFLAKKSSFFKRIFENDSQMHEPSKTLMEDIDSSTMKEVLRFLYCGSVCIRDVKLLTSVLHAAGCYKISELVAQCIDGLMEQINKENVIEILDIAVEYGHDELEKKCLTVILNYGHSISGITKKSKTLTT